MRNRMAKARTTSVALFVVSFLLLGPLFPPIEMPMASGSADSIAVILDRIERKIIEIDSAGNLTTLHSDIGVSPIGFAVDANGNFIVVDTNHANPGNVLRITPAGTFTSIQVGTDPYSIDIDDQGNYIIVDAFEQKVLRVTPGGSITTVATLGSPPQPGITGTSGLTDVEIDVNGDYIVLDNGGGGAGRLFKVTPLGSVTTIVSSLGVDPFGLAIDSNGDFIIVDDEAGPAGSGVVFKVIPSGQVSQVASGLGTHIHEVAIERSGDYLIVDPASGSPGDLYRVTPQGVIQVLLADFSSEPVDILVPLDAHERILEEVQRIEQKLDGTRPSLVTQILDAVTSARVNITSAISSSQSAILQAVSNTQIAIINAVNSSVSAAQITIIQAIANAQNAIINTVLSRLGLFAIAPNSVVGVNAPAEVTIFELKQPSGGNPFQVSGYIDAEQLDSRDQMRVNIYVDITNNGVFDPRLMVFQTMQGGVSETLQIGSHPSQFGIRITITGTVNDISDDTIFFQFFVERAGA